MTQARFTRRSTLNAVIASSVALAAIAGCQTPASVPSTGARQAQAFPGTTGEQFAQDDSTRRLESVATNLTIASATASVNANQVSSVLDTNIASAWSTGASTSAALTLTLSTTSSLSELNIKATPSGTYAIDVSADGTTWTTAVAAAKNTTWNVEAKALPAGTTGKYVRLRFTNANVMVFQAGLKGTMGATGSTTGVIGGSTSSSSGAATGGTVTASGLTASASSATSGFAAAAAIDASTDTQWSSGTANNPVLTLDLGTAGTLTAVAAKVAPGAAYVISTSADGATWTQAVAAKANTTWNVETRSLPANTRGRYVRLAFNGKVNAQVFDVKVTTSGGAVVTPTSVPTLAPTTAPTTAPTSAPTTTPVQSSAPVSGTAIIVNTNNVLHPADSHILGTCRNHVTSDFPNGAAKLAAMSQLVPTWGEKKYLYRVGHGVTDGRNDYSYMTGFHFEKVWDATGSYPYDDIRDALREANTMGADQMHVVNFGTSDPSEAGRYVSFLNKAGDANRAAHPIAQQNVQMFELGNEISWNVERGHDQYAATETQYATRAKQFAQQMRANSDVPIKIGAVAGTNSNWMGTGWSGGATSVKNIMQTMGNDVDFLIYHGYPSWPMNISNNLITYMAQNEWNRQKLESEIKPAIKQYANGRDVFIANTEFFSNLYNDVPHSRGMFGAMYSADSLLLAMNEDIRTCVQFCFDHKEMADASFFINNDPNNTTPVFKLQKMLAQHWGDNIVQTTGQQIPSQTVTGASATISMPKLAYSAATTGNKTWVMVLNRTNDSDVTSSVSLGYTPSAVTSYTLGGSSGWDSTNGDVTTASGVKLNNVTFKRATVTIFEITR